VLEREQVALGSNTLRYIKTGCGSFGGFIAVDKLLHAGEEETSLPHDIAIVFRSRHFKQNTRNVKIFLLTTGTKYSQKTFPPFIRKTCDVATH